MRTLFTLFSLFILIALLHCSPTESEFKDFEMTLDVLSDATESWITVTIGNISPKYNYTLKRGNVTIYKGQLEKEQTLFNDDSLFASENYTYSIFAEKRGEKSETVKSFTTTMDTTTQDFTIQHFKWGSLAYSILNDVAIINENDIWVVGRISTLETDRWNADSSGWIPAYNAIHWNGSNWTFKHIKWDDMSSRLSCVAGFATNNVWFGITNLIHWNGTSFEKNINHLLKNYKSPLVNRIWGLEGKEFYIIGEDGKII